jgi:hypothetical protein
MSDWIQWAIRTAVAILGILAGRNWYRFDEKVKKDKKVLEKFDEIIPYSVMDFIHHHDFSETFRNNIFINISKLIGESENPDFFFLDKQLEKIKQEFISKMKEFNQILGMNSGPIKNGELSGIPIEFDSITKEEGLIILKVNSLADELFDIYSRLKKVARRKL